MRILDWDWAAWFLLPLASYSDPQFWLAHRVGNFRHRNSGSAVSGWHLDNTLDSVRDGTAAGWGDRGSAGAS